MPHYQAAQFISPFGKRIFLRSTHPEPTTESYTFSSASMTPNQTIDGLATRVLQPGTAIAKITSGPEAGSVGLFQAGAADGRQDVANLVGLNLTFLPRQLNFRDVEIAVAYICVAKLAQCVEHDAGGLEVPLAVATADAMRNTRGLDCNFV